MEFAKAFIIIIIIVIIKKGWQCRQSLLLLLYYYYYYIGNFVSPTWTCAVGFNNNNNFRFYIRFFFLMSQRQHVIGLDNFPARTSARTSPARTC